MIHCPKNSDDGQGSDTYWDVYGRYSGEWNGIKLAGVAGWSAANGCKQEQTVSETVAVSGFNGSGCINSPFAAGPGAGGLNPANISGDVGYFQSGIYVEHVATGVWVLFNYGQEFLQDMPTGTNNFNTNFSVLNSDPYHWYLKAGLRERWTSLGHTALYGFYSERHDMIDAALVWNDNIVGARRESGAWVSCRKWMPLPCLSGYSGMRCTPLCLAVTQEGKHQLMVVRQASLAMAMQSTALTLA